MGENTRTDITLEDSRIQGAKGSSVGQRKGRRTDIGCLMSDVGGQKADDRGQRTEVR